MNARDAIKLCWDSSNMVCMGYIDDMTDDELMKRPHEQCNHIKWQLGHLISSENQMIGGVAPGSMPALPEGFAEKYAKETSTSDDAAAFDSKEELLALFKQQREAALAALDGMSDEDLDAPAPEHMQAYAPNVAAVFSLAGNHWMMHAGQWAVIRRQLGRPVMF